jgi:hypothetical protein
MKKKTVTAETMNQKSFFLVRQFGKYLYDSMRRFVGIGGYQMRHRQSALPQLTSSRMRWGGAGWADRPPGGN